MGHMKKYSQFLKELPNKTVVFAFGRFNPPTTGHELLIKAVKKLAATHKADHAIYASKTQDSKKNPLAVDKKVHYLNLMFPGTTFVAANAQERTFVEAIKNLNKKYKSLIMVAGSDRVPEYEKILAKYNGKEFHYDTMQVISAGERDPDADDASGMSASKMRATASKGDYSHFKQGLPSTMRDIDGRRLMNDVRMGMGLESIKEQINLVKNDLREQYFHGEIFNIGDIVEANGQSYEIVKRGSNHLLLKEQSGKLVSKWIQDVSVAKELHLEESMLPEELTDKTLKPTDKIKVARIIATMLGTDNAEASANPEMLINTALRKIRSKALNPEALKILDKMLALATEVGIQYDATLKPSKLKEGVLQPNGTDEIPVTTDSPVVNKNSKFNIAKDRLRYSDFVKLKKMNLPENVAEGSGDKKPYPNTWHDVDPKLGKQVDKMSPEEKVKKGYANPSILKKNKQQGVAKEIAEDTLDEISQKLAGDYYGAATKKHIDKVGVKPNMYDRIEKDMGKKRKAGVDRALDRVMGQRKTNEEIKENPAVKELAKANLAAKHAKEKESLTSKHKQEKESMKESTDYDSALRALDEAMAVIDKGEYDYEGAMARTQLQTTIRNSQELINMLSMDENLPEWVQSKITLAQDYISSVRDYLKSREELGEATAYYNKPSFLKKMSRVAKQERLAREKKEKEAKDSKQIKEGEIETSDYKLDKSGKKYKAHKLKVEQAITNPAAGHNDGHQTLKYSDLARLLGVQQPFSAGPEKSNDDLEQKYGDKPEDVDSAMGYQSNTTSQITVPHMDPAVHGQSHSKRSYGELKHLINRKVKYALGEETESQEDDLDDDEFDDEVNSMSEPEHIIDAYDDEELAVVDDDSGEELMGMHEYKDDDKEEVKEEVILEAIGRMERIRRAQRFARTKSKREVRTKFALRKTSNMATINKRSRRLAVSMIKKRMLRKDPATASVQEKERIETFLQRRKDVIDRLARRVAPRVRQIEKARLQHKKYTK